MVGIVSLFDSWELSMVWEIISSIATLLATGVALWIAIKDIKVHNNDNRLSKKPYYRVYHTSKKLDKPIYSTFRFENITDNIGVQIAVKINGELFKFPYFPTKNNSQCINDLHFLEDESEGFKSSYTIDFYYCDIMQYYYHMSFLLQAPTEIKTNHEYCLEVITDEYIRKLPEELVNFLKLKN